MVRIVEGPDHAAREFVEPWQGIQAGVLQGGMEGDEDSDTHDGDDDGHRPAHTTETGTQPQKCWRHNRRQQSAYVPGVVDSRRPQHGQQPQQGQPSR